MVAQSGPAQCRAPGRTSHAPSAGGSTEVPHEFDGVEHDLSRPVTEGVLESIHDLPAVVDREAFVGERGSGHVVARGFVSEARSACLTNDNWPNIG